MHLSRYHVASEPVVDNSSGVTKRVIFSTRTAQICLIDDYSWNLIKSSQHEKLPEKILFDLIDLELLVPDGEDELQVILRRNAAEIDDEKRLYLVIHPTSYCQLGCGYCGQEHKFGQLSDENQDRFVERARTKLSSKKFETLEISWFGGEPLIGLAVIRRLAPRLKKLAQDFGCSYRSKIVTNGLGLTDQVITELAKNIGINHIEITLDGTAEFHDKRRHTKDGKATFEQIFRNTVNLAKREDLADVRISIRCNVDKRNYEGVEPLLRLIADAGIQTRVAFYVAPIHAWGNNADSESLSKEEFAQWEIKWFAIMSKLGFKPKLVPSRRPIVCMALSSTSEVVDANGDLFNCTEVSYVPKYGSPNKYAIGNLKDGEIHGRRRSLGDFNERVARKEYDCSSCPMLPVCGGGCPKLWQEGVVPCPSAKFNIETRLLLEYAMTRM